MQRCSLAGPGTLTTCVAIIPCPAKSVQGWPSPSGPECRMRRLRLIAPSLHPSPAHTLRIRLRRALRPLHSISLSLRRVSSGLRCGSLLRFYFTVSGKHYASGSTTVALKGECNKGENASTEMLGRSCEYAVEIEESCGLRWKSEGKLRMATCECGMNSKTLTTDSHGFSGIESGRSSEVLDPTCSVSIQHSQVVSRNSLRRFYSVVELLKQFLCGLDEVVL